MTVATPREPAETPRRRPLRAERSAVYDLPGRGGAQVRLQRFRGGDKGPVVLAPGLGVSSLIFAIETLPTNLLEFLYERGWDVWLFDYRTAIELPSASAQCTADEIAREDYPAAFAKVREATGAETVQVVAHCFGATTFCMAMLAGLEGVRAAVCSQVAMHLVTPFQTRLKCRLHVPDLLAALQLRSLTAKVPEKPGLLSRLYGRLLALLPTAAGERCDSPVCQRIAFMYGNLYRHLQLDDDTHRALAEMFGVANMRGFRQLGMMVRRGHLVDAAGAEVYMPHLERLAIPLAFVHGAENACYLPRSTELSYQLLCERNDPALYRRHVVPGYGHIDCIFGSNAWKDVYPLVSAHLEETALA
jgi:cholesterol oxidase